VAENQVLTKKYQFYCCRKNSAKKKNHSFYNFCGKISVY